jgi:predicted flap endonuclease-1-like 5' DNA nuclease
MEDLHNQILGLKARNSQLAGEQQESASPAALSAIPIAALEELSARLEKLEMENRELRRRQEQISSSPQGGEADLAALQEMEEKLDRLEREHAGLRSLGEKLRRLEQENASLKAVAVKLQKLESEHAQLQEMQRKLAALEHNRQETARGAEPGPPSPSLLLYKDPLDLKVIEGVGPRIEELLKAAGIDSWVDLSHTPLETLRAILRDAGSDFSLHDPASWPQQARLATEGRWEELQAYQQDLKGGRETEEKISED